MRNRLNYIMWYHKLFGTNKKAEKALEYYGGFERLYEVVVNKADTQGLLQSFPESRLFSWSLMDSFDIIEQCRDMGGDVISFESPYYPEPLKNINNSPKILFYQGDKEILKEKLFVSIVGSRDATDEALAISYNCAYNMAKSGAVIVSGAALGVDSAAHKGALAAGGATVGVLGCGLGSEYMTRLGGFYDKVCKNGVYITEMLPQTSPSKYSFPERNRIISGMSRAVLVTYAGEKSGSLITAENARKQKRRVYALSPELCPSDGCKKLISDGAYVFHSAGDIIFPLKEYCVGRFDEIYCNRSVKTNDLTAADYTIEKEQAEEKPAKKVMKMKKSADKAVSAKEKLPEKEEKRTITEIPDYVSEDAKTVYAALPDGRAEVDGLVPLTGLSIQNILAAISELEIFGFVKSLPGKTVEKI